MSDVKYTDDRMIIRIDDGETYDFVASTITEAVGLFEAEHFQPDQDVLVVTVVPPSELIRIDGELEHETVEQAAWKWARDNANGTMIGTTAW